MKRPIEISIIKRLLIMIAYTIKLTDYKMNVTFIYREERRDLLCVHVQNAE